MNKLQSKYLFGDIVVVENYLIGVVVKVWEALRKEKNTTREHYNYEVYVRNYRNIIEYPESKVERYRVLHKELGEQELKWQNN